MTAVFAPRNAVAAARRRVQAGRSKDSQALGYGSGLYDRTAAAARQASAGMPGIPLAVGVGYESGRLPTIHPRLHDQPMDMLVTEQGTWWPRAVELVADARPQP